MFKVMVSLVFWRGFSFLVPNSARLILPKASPKSTRERRPTRAKQEKTMEITSADEP